MTKYDGFLFRPRVTTTIGICSGSVLFPPSERVLVSTCNHEKWGFFTLKSKSESEKSPLQANGGTTRTPTRSRRVIFHSIACEVPGTDRPLTLVEKCPFRKANTQCQQTRIRWGCCLCEYLSRSQKYPAIPPETQLSNFTICPSRHRVMHILQ